MNVFRPAQRCHFTSAKWYVYIYECAVLCCAVSQFELLLQLREIRSDSDNTCLLFSCAPSFHHLLQEILVDLKFSIPPFSLAVDILGNIQQFSVLV